MDEGVELVDKLGDGVEGSGVMKSLDTVLCEPWFWRKKQFKRINPRGLKKFLAEHLPRGLMSGRGCCGLNNQDLGPFCFSTANRWGFPISAAAQLCLRD